MSLKHQDHDLQVDVQHDEVGGDADLCVDERSVSIESTSSCNSRATSSRRGSRRTTSSKLNDSKADTPTLSTHSRQERIEKLKVHSLKAGSKEGFRGKWQEYSQAAKCRPSLFPPIKPQGVAVQHVMLASRHRINELGNQVRELQQQLAAATTEIRLLKRQQGLQEGALRQLQDLQNGLPQVLLQHNNEVHTLQELLYRARSRISALVRQLNASETRLLNTGDALRKLQQLSQDRSLGERDELAQRVNTLTLELDLKNKRIQDLEKNLELTNASFNRQLSSQVQKAHQARDLSDSLQEEISYLKQKISEQVRLLEIRNIYSYRFSEKPPRKATKESKSVQTEHLCTVHKEVATSTPETENETSEDLEDFEMASRNQISMESCHEQSDDAQDDVQGASATECAVVESDDSPARDEQKEDTIYSEDISVETLPDFQEQIKSTAEEMKDRHISEEEEEEEPEEEQQEEQEEQQKEQQEEPKREKEVGQRAEQEEEHVVLDLLDDHSEAVEEHVPDIIQEEETKPSCQDDERRHTKPEASDTTYPLQTPSSSTMPPERPPSSLPRTHHHLSFKETIQNLHLGRPAYHVPGRHRRRNCETCSKDNINMDHIDIETYEPSFAKFQSVKPQTPVSLHEKKMVKKKRKLMKELFGKDTLTYQ